MGGFAVRVIVRCGSCGSRSAGRAASASRARRRGGARLSRRLARKKKRVNAFSETPTRSSRRKASFPFRASDTRPTSRRNDGLRPVGRSRLTSTWNARTRVDSSVETRGWGRGDARDATRGPGRTSNSRMNVASGSACSCRGRRWRGSATRVRGDAPPAFCKS